jgi:putative transposase
MLGFKSMHSARAVLSGLEMVHMKWKRQAKDARNVSLSLAGQFEQIAM